MKVKVCGITNPRNLLQLSMLKVDMIGYNFYPESKRYVGENMLLSLIALPTSIKKVGVFVNASIEFIKEQQETYKLDYLQLHGDESQEMMTAIREIALVIKVFRITPDFDFENTKAYSSADLFLFDTYTKDFGGSGQRFDWEKLDDYEGDTPFLLAGGIGPDDVSAILKINHPDLYGVDINSGFESAPGIKEAKKINTFIKELKSNR